MSDGTCARTACSCSSVYDRIPVAALGLDRDGVVNYANDRAVALLRAARERLVSRAFFELVHASDRDAARSALDTAWSDGVGAAPGDVDLTMLAGDGAIAPVVASLALESNESGERTCCRVVLVDVRRRRDAERAVEQRGQQLQDFLDHSGDLIQSVDDEGRIGFVNRAWCEALGYEATEVLGRSVFDFVAPTHRDACRAELARVVRGEGEPTVETVLLTRHGRALTVEGRVSVRRLDADQTETRGYFRDVTARRAAELAERRSREELARKNAELSRSGRIKDEFLAATSHELRTPLTGILGMTEALTDGLYGELTEPQKKALSTVDESGRHLLELINDILDFSRAESGQLELHVERTSVRSLCDAALALVRESARRKHQRMHFSIHPDDIEIEADARRVKQMLVNLLGNAVKFTPERGRISLDVELGAASDEVRFVVADDGIGIAQEDLAKLFRPFTQLDGALARRQAGTGLGLSLVQRMAELQGGGVQVESAVGKGSRFTLILPSVGLGARGGPSSLRHFAPSSREIEPPASVRPRRVLVVDDNELNLGFLVDFLRSIGHRVSVARNGLQAIDQTRELRPDIVLMDLQMPELDGLEATRRIRADDDEHVASTPIVALTALALEGDRERALEAGVDDHLAKPVALRVVKETIERLARASAHERGRAADGGAAW
jgi:PAS domain S-box-containing protein